MASLIVRNLTEEVKAHFRRRAARHGRSMEAELRLLVEEASRQEQEASEEDAHLVARMRQRVERGGTETDLELPARRLFRTPPDAEKW